jgi:hypothetical protein
VQAEQALTPRVAISAKKARSLERVVLMAPERRYPAFMSFIGVVARSTY